MPIIYALLIAAIVFGGLALILRRRERIYGELPFSDLGLIYFGGAAATGLGVIFGLSVVAQTHSWHAPLAIPLVIALALAGFYIWQEAGIRSLLAAKREQTEEAIRKTLEFISQRPNSVPALENLARLYGLLGKDELARQAAICAQKAQERGETPLEKQP